MVSSENRKYIPMDFIEKNIVANNKSFIIPNADLFLFGVLQSSVHMIFVKKFCGRLKSDFSYSAQIVYNNFPFPSRSEKICETAAEILRVRKKYSESSLADLYDENLMPKDLRDAHKKNDLAVCEAYGFDKNFSDEEILSALMKIYQDLTSAE